MSPPCVTEKPLEVLNSDSKTMSSEDVPQVIVDFASGEFSDVLCPISKHSLLLHRSLPSRRKLTRPQRFRSPAFPLSLTLFEGRCWWVSAKEEGNPKTQEGHDLSPTDFPAYCASSFLQPTKKRKDSDDDDSDGQSSFFFQSSNLLHCSSRSKAKATEGCNKGQEQRSQARWWVGFQRWQQRCWIRLRNRKVCDFQLFFSLLISFLRVVTRSMSLSWRRPFLSDELVRASTMPRLKSAATSSSFVNFIFMLIVVAVMKNRWSRTLFDLLDDEWTPNCHHIVATQSEINKAERRLNLKNSVTFRSSICWLTTVWILGVDQAWGRRCLSRRRRAFQSLHLQVNPWVCLVYLLRILSHCVNCQCHQQVWRYRSLIFSERKIWTNRTIELSHLLSVSLFRRLLKYRYHLVRKLFRSNSMME